MQKYGAVTLVNIEQLLTGQRFHKKNLSPAKKMSMADALFMKSLNKSNDSKKGPVSSITGYSTSSVRGSWAGSMDSVKSFIDSL